MTISVCMIIRNEQDILKRALDCAKQFADEIIIVDTGSKDKTKKIALNYTHKVYDFVWCNDFAKARNYAFSLATCDYIMWLDADDFIDKNNIDKILKLKDSEMCADVYMFKYKYGDDFIYYRERILKRTCNFIWQGFIHEAISCYGQIEYLDIEIEHKKQVKSDKKRNLNIYRWHLRKGAQFDARAQYYYAKELFYNHYYYKCILELKKFLKMPNKFTPNEIDAYLTICKCYQYLSKQNLALKFAFIALTKIEPNSELLCLIADIFYNENNKIIAEKYYKFALQCEPNYTSGAFIDKTYYYIYPLLQLTIINYRLGKIDKAKYYHELCKLDSPNNESVKYNEKFFKENKLTII